MEDLRILPLAMFFAGALLIYSGFTNQAPSDVVRNALRRNPNNAQEDLYSADRNPIYAGVPISTYSRPVAYADRGYFY
ncbi:MAG: hypothetical protein AB7I44_21145 [Hyphomicrobiaceae bacterium]|jgi:hypothetical protein